MRVVIADDSVLLREGLVRVLTEAGMEVVAQVGDADALHGAVRLDDPDVAIIDIRMPPTHTDEGARAAEELRARFPELGILLLSQTIEPTRALRLFRDSPERFGYLLKDRVLDVDDFVEAIRRVARGGTAVDPQVVAAVMGSGRARSVLSELTPRELDVLALMAEGRSNQAIAQTLFITGKTVETHVKSIFGKLRLAPAPEDHRRVLAVLAYLDQG
jgi:DNA-binding NarL/FixJ family response regulator